MSKPVWKHTHNGEKNEELFECEGKYYERFAWDNFLAAYTGKVRPAHRDRPPVDYSSVEFDSWKYAWSPHPSHATTTGPQIADDDPGWVDLFPADEKTDPMPPTVIRPGKLIASFPLKKKLDPTGKFGYWLDDSMGLTVESMSSGASATIDHSVLESLRELFACNDMPSAVFLATDIHNALSSMDNSIQPEEAAHIIRAWDALTPGSKKLP